MGMLPDMVAGQWTTHNTDKCLGKDCAVKPVGLFATQPRINCWRRWSWSL